MSHQHPRMRTGNYGAPPPNCREEREANEAAQKSDDRFRAALHRAGYREHVSTKESTAHPKFTPGHVHHSFGRSAIADL